MARDYERCLQTLMDEVDGLPAEQISDGQMARMRLAGGWEDAGQNVFECQVPDCSMEQRTQIIAGKLMVMSSDVITGQQPCA